MNRRSAGILMILLLCMIAVSCRKDSDGTDNLKDKEQEVLVHINASSETDALKLTPEDSLLKEEGKEEAEGKAEAMEEAMEEAKGKGKVEGKIEPEFKEADGQVMLVEEATNTGTEVTNMVILKDIRVAFGDRELKEILKAYPAGTRLKIEDALDNELDTLFYSEELSEEIKSRINGKSYGADCDMPYEQLRYIRVLHKGFDGDTYIGELIVNKAVAQDIVDIFSDLYAISYPIERMLLVDEYNADDNQSMAANNSSAFNYRFIHGTTRLSNHSFGYAIDINPLYNPYIIQQAGETVVLPSNGEEYADRTKDNPYYIREGDPCFEAFASRGFAWGGFWEDGRDYQHFQKVLE